MTATCQHCNGQLVDAVDCLICLDCGHEFIPGGMTININLDNYKKRRYIEGKIHRACWRYYSGFGKNWKSPMPMPFPQLVMWHTPNEGYDGSDEAARRGAILKQMGLVKGAYDFTCMWPGPYGKGVIEIKAPGQKLEAAQDKFKHRILAADGKTVEAHSVTEFRDILIRWGLECHNMAVFEPDLRDWSQKVQDGIDVFAP